MKHAIVGELAWKEPRYNEYYAKLIRFPIMRKKQ